MTTVNPLFVKLCIPTGLEEVLEGLAREVLRRQPENINSFAAVYFDKLLAIRNEAEKRGSDINLNNLIARGKLLDINEEDLIKISIKEETSIDGNDSNIDRDKETKFGKSQNVDEETIRPKMVTAAAISKPSEIRISQPINDVTIEEDFNDKNGENRESDQLEKGSKDDEDLDKTTNNRESLEVQEAQSEKSSDNSETDKEQSEELESELETTMGMQQDENLSQKEDVNLLVETETDNDILLESIEDVAIFENSEEILAPGSARASKTAEFQLSENPAEVIEENETTESPMNQLDQVLNVQNDKLEVDEMIENNSTNEFLMSDEIQEPQADVSLKSTDLNASVDESMKEDDDDNKDEKVKLEEVVQETPSDELEVTSNEIQEIDEDSSLMPNVDLEDALGELVNDDRTKNVEIQEIVRERPSDELMTSNQDSDDVNKTEVETSTDELRERSAIEGIDKTSSIDPIESTIEDLDENLVREDAGINEFTAKSLLEDSETKIPIENSVTDENDMVIQKGIMDNEPTSALNVVEIQPQVTPDETAEETNKDKGVEITEESEEETKQETRGNSQNSEVMFTMDEEGVFEVRALRQQPEEIRGIQTDENLSTVIVLDETADKHAEKKTEDEIRETSRATQNVNERDANQLESTDVAESLQAEDTLEGKLAEGDLPEIVQTDKTNEDEKQAGTDTNELTSTDATSDERETDSNIASESNLLQEMREAQPLNQEVEGIQEMEMEELGESLQTDPNTNDDEQKQTDVNLDELNVVTDVELREQSTDQTNEKLPENEFQDVLEIAQNIQDEEQTETAVDEKESDIATEDKLVEVTTDQDEEQAESAVREKESTTASAIEDNLLDESTDQNEEKQLEEKSQEIATTAQTVQDEENTETDVGENVATDKLLQEAAGEIEENAPQDVIETAQKIEVNAHIEPDNKLEESAVITEDGLPEETSEKLNENATATDQNDEQLLEEKSQEIATTAQAFPNEENTVTDVYESLATNKLLQESTGGREEKEATKEELQDELQPIPNVQNEEQTETDNIQLEPKTAADSELLEDTSNKIDENIFEAQPLRQEDLEGTREIKISDETTNRFVEKTEDFQEISQADKNTEDNEHLGIDNNQLESIVSTEGKPKESTDQTDEKTSESEFQGDLLTVQNAQDEEQKETDVNQEDLTPVATEVGIFEESRDKPEEKTSEKEFQENLQAVQNAQVKEKSETHVNQEDPTSVATEIGILEESTDKIEEKTTENEFQENLQAVQNGQDAERTETDVNHENLTSGAKEVGIPEEKIEEKLQDLLQTDQNPDDDNRVNSNNDKIESTSIDLNTKSNMAPEETEISADNEGLESTSLQDEGELKNRVENNEDVPGEITNAMQDSTAPDEGQEIEGENKLAEERNSIELANNTENDDLMSEKVNDTLNVEAPERGTNEIQNADELVTLEVKPQETQNQEIEPQLQNENSTENTPDIKTESGEISNEENIADSMTQNDKLKDVQEDQAMDIAQEHPTASKNDNDQKQTEDNAEKNVGETYEENLGETSEENLEKLLQATTETGIPEANDENNADLQQNIAELKEVDILPSVSDVSQINDAQSIVTTENTTDTAVNESFAEEQQPPEEVLGDDATTRAKVDNTDDIINDSKGAMIEDNDDSLKVNNEDKLKTEVIPANLDNELDEKSEEIENDALMEELPEKAADEPTASKQELEKDDLKIQETTEKQDDESPDDSEVTEETINQLELPKETDVEDSLEKADEDAPQTIAGNEMESIEPNEIEKQMEVSEDLMTTKDKVLEESIAEFDISNERESLPVSDQLQPTDSLNPDEATSLTSQITDTEQEPRMENQIISSDEAETEVENAAQVEENANDVINENEQLSQQTEIFKEIISPETDKPLTSELVDSTENAANQDLITEANQPSIVLTENEDKNLNENSENERNTENDDPSSKISNNVLQDQIFGNVNDEALEIENNLIDLDSLEYENRKTEEVSNMRYDVPELDSLEYSQAIEEKVNQTEDGQEMDSLEVNKTAEDSLEAKPELQELKRSLQGDETNMKEENPQISNEQTDQKNMIAISLTDDKPESDIKEIQPLNETEFSTKSIKPITENGGEQVNNKDNLEQNLIVEELENSESSNLPKAQEIMTETMVDNNESKEITSEEDVQQQIIQSVSNEPTDLIFGQAIDEKTESANKITAEEIEENTDISLSDKNSKEFEAIGGSVDEATITQKPNFNEEKQFEKSDEVLGEPESEVVEENNDEILKSSEEVKADDLVEIVEPNPEIAQETENESSTKFSDIITPEEIEMFNENLKQDDVSGLISGDIQAKTDGILMKEVAEGVESTTHENLENGSEIQSVNLTNPSQTAEEVNEPEIIKEIEQLDEPNFTDLYNKLQNNSDIIAEENQGNEKEVNQEIYRETDKETNAETANENINKDTNEDLPNQEMLQKDSGEFNSAKVVESLEIQQEILLSTVSEEFKHVNETAIVTDVDLKESPIVDDSTNDQEDNQSLDNILPEILSENNEDDDGRSTSLDPRENLQEPEVNILNEGQEETQDVSETSAGILTEKDTEINSQENGDDGPLAMENNTENAQMADQLLTMDNAVNEMEQTSEKERPNNEQSVEIAEVNQTELHKLTEEQHILEENQLADNALTELEIDKETEENTTVEESEENLDGETLTDNFDKNQTTEQKDDFNSNDIMEDSSNNDEVLVDATITKTNDNKNGEMSSSTIEIVNEPTITDNEIFDLGSNQKPEEIRANEIQKSEENESGNLASDEIGPEMSSETSLLELDDNLEKSKDTIEEKIEDELVTASAIAQSLEIEQSSELESIDVKNAIATRDDEPGEPFQPQDENKPEEQRQEESKPEGQNQEEDERGLEEAPETMTNDEEVEILREEDADQLEGEMDIGENVIKAFLDGQTDEIVTLTDREDRSSSLIKQRNMELEEPKKLSAEIRRLKEGDKNDAKIKEKIKEESNINGFEILGQSIVLKPKKLHDKIESNNGQTEQDTVRSEGQDDVNVRIGPDITVEISKQDDDDGFMEPSSGTKDFKSISDGEQDQLDNKTIIVLGDDQDEDNDVMIGQGLKSPPEEPLAVLNNLVP